MIQRSEDDSFKLDGTASLYVNVQRTNPGSGIEGLLFCMNFLSEQADALS